MCVCLFPVCVGHRCVVFGEMCIRCFARCLKLGCYSVAVAWREFLVGFGNESRSGCVVCKYRPPRGRPPFRLAGGSLCCPEASEMDGVPLVYFASAQAAVFKTYTSFPFSRLPGSMNMYANKANKATLSLS